METFDAMLDQSSYGSTASLSTAQPETRHAEDTADRVNALIKTDFPSQSPIDNLPPELVAHIFSWLAVVDPLRWKPTSIDYDYPLVGWIKVSHVSQKWRQIACGHSSLWTVIDSTAVGICWATEMAARSKLLPLSITIRESSTPDVWPTYLADHLSRTQQLNLAVFSPDARLNVLGSPAPMLERLNIGSSDAGVSNFLFTPLFANDAPRLHSVKLHGCINIPWGSPVFRGFVCFEITRGLAPPQDFVYPTQDQLLTILRASPDLLTLLLKDCLPQVIAPVVLENDLVELPHLTSLALSGTATDCFLTMGLLHIPPSSRVNMRCRMQDSVNSERGRVTMANIISLLSGHIKGAIRPILSHRPGTTPPIRSLMVSSYDGNYLHLLGWRTYSGDSDGPVMFPRNAQHPLDFSLFLQLAWQPGVPDTSEPLPLTAIERLPLQSVQHLFVAARDQSWTARYWQKMARELRHVGHLRLERVPLHLFLDAFEETGDAGDRGAVLWPGLQSLTLGRNDILDYFLGTTVIVQRLYECLDKRKRVGAPLERLIIVPDIRLPQSWIDLLSSVVSFHGYETEPL
ncbi:hypothetical protein BV25DRAFT_1547039 [Artomyces pyxidatus]|uniref:Uncharacterized protein n=1 Tax=Artomyces pyxidatus TaxID=48021 RepID=A0ACB8SKI7_9AGAM|nr:hypothetical protein BV25DRAFT_1547039 [Artomyces pyxidatus]